MNRTLLTLLAALAVGESVAAQDGLPPVVPLDRGPEVVQVRGGQPPAAAVTIPTTAAPCGPAPCVIPTTPCPTGGPRLRGSAEFLLWFVERQRLDTPVILSNTNPAQDLSTSFEAGSLADPTAVAVYGPGGIGASTYPGFRAMIGTDLTADGRYGVELGGFWLPRVGDRFTFASNASGVPVIVLPYTNINPDPNTGPLGESGGAFAGNFAGTPLAGYAEVLTATQLWGADLNLTVACKQRPKCTVEWLAGFRYVGMNDLFQITAAVTQNGDGTTYDRFATLNNFYGPQIGVRGEWRPGVLAFTASTKLAMGVTNSVLDISGNAVLPSYAAGSPQLPGGFYTSAGNIGRTEQINFAVVSETNMGIRVAVTSRIDLTAGYSLFYWSNVQRAAENVSRQFNPTFNPAFAPVTGSPPLSGPVPPRLNQTTDIWAHGLNVGVQVRY